MRMTSAIARLIERERVCRVATAGRRGMPHLVPVCQVVAGGKIYFASGNEGRKVLKLGQKPPGAVTAAVYSQDRIQPRGVSGQARAGGPVAGEAALRDPAIRRPQCPP